MDDEKRGFDEWLATRPECIQALGRQWPGWQCYRLRGASPRGHYRIYSYDEGGTVALLHGSDSNWPGVGTFGQSPDDLVVCGCGKWEQPTQAQADAARASLLRLRAAHLVEVCEDPECHLHGPVEPE